MGSWQEDLTCKVNKGAGQLSCDCAADLPLSFRIMKRFSHDATELRNELSFIWVSQICCHCLNALFIGLTVGQSTSIMPLVNNRYSLLKQPGIPLVVFCPWSKIIKK